jgi:hypothetical protein
VFRTRLLLAVLVIAAARGAFAQAGAAPTGATHGAQRYVIPPGAEPLFSEMLGSGQTLPGGCTFTDGQIQQATVRATYSCGGQTVVLELAHPTLAATAAAHSDRFAIVVQSGTPPNGFVDAVAERVRAREGAFQWVELAVPPEPSRGSLLVPAVIAAAAVLVLVVMRWLAGRRRAA